MADQVTVFPVDAELTAVAAAYRNEDYIADFVLPRVPVGVQSFKYKKFDPRDSFTIPDTVVGRKSEPNQVEFGFEEVDSSAVGYGLDEVVPNTDIENAPNGYKPLDRATSMLTNLIELDRERRTAGLVFNASTYSAANKTVLSGAAQYSNPASDPIKGILDAMDGCIIRPNKMVIGQGAWTALRTHPKIAKATHGNAGDVSIAARQAVAELFELQDIYVGKGWYNAANKGKETMTLTRIWGNHIALIYQDALPGPDGLITYGFTAQFGQRVANRIPKPEIGLSGSEMVRVGEYVRELVVAGDMGYFIQNAAA